MCLKDCINCFVYFFQILSNNDLLTDNFDTSLIELKRLLWNHYIFFQIFQHGKFQSFDNFLFDHFLRTFFDLFRSPHRSIVRKYLFGQNLDKISSLSTEIGAVKTDRNNNNNDNNDDNINNDDKAGDRNISETQHRISDIHRKFEETKLGNEIFRWNTKIKYWIFADDRKDERSSKFKTFEIVQTQNWHRNNSRCPQTLCQTLKHFKTKLFFKSFKTKLRLISILLKPDVWNPFEKDLDWVCFCFWYGEELWYLNVYTECYLI